MPRQSRGRSAPASRAAPAQTRTASTLAAPTASAPARAPAPAAPAAAATAQTKEPGMLAQMAATAGSVAVGSTIGHGISHMLFGGSSSAPPAEAQAPPSQTQRTTMSCEAPAKEFSQCLEKADLQSCSWYLEQLKACQAAAAPY